MKPRISFFRSILSVLAAVGAVALSSLALSAMRGVLTTAVIALLFLVPVVISAALWGRLAGISASVLSFLVFLFFFVPPHNTFNVAQPQDFLVMLVFLGVAVLISSLAARVQTNVAQVEAREREAAQLYELSLELTGRNDEATIARTLAHRIAGSLPGARIEVEVYDPGPDDRSDPGYRSSGQHVVARVPENGESPGAPVQCIPLTSPRGALGEIRIWNPTEKLLPEKARLLQTFASQGALALDRALLDASETRARVLEESDRLKTAILSSVSHELRTPLATIQASATSLFNPAVELQPEAQAELQSLLLEETDRMVQLVGNLLNMSRIEAGALKLQRQWNAMAEIVDTSVRRLRRVTGGRSIEVDVSEDLPLVSVDSVLMEQVVVNLVRNSLKFAPPNSPIRIHAQADDQALRISVSNEGPHIPEEYLEHVFEKFYPVPRPDTTQSTGLGLSICKGIVEAHGGKIWAANLPVGVAFHFTLPLSWAGARPVLPDAEGEG